MLYCSQIANSITSEKKDVNVLNDKRADDLSLKNSLPLHTQHARLSVVAGLARNLFQVIVVWDPGSEAGMTTVIAEMTAEVYERNFSVSTLLKKFG